MSFGRKLPPGRLPVYSVDTEAEAAQLIGMTCSRSLNGQYIAQELEHEQTLENLYAFSDRLDAMWKLTHATTAKEKAVQRKRLNKLNLRRMKQLYGDVEVIPMAKKPAK